MNIYLYIQTYIYKSETKYLSSCRVKKKEQKKFLLIKCTTGCAFQSFACFLKAFHCISLRICY